MPVCWNAFIPFLVDICIHGHDFYRITGSCAIMDWKMCVMWRKGIFIFLICII